MDYEAVINALVEKAVAKWGESARGEGPAYRRTYPTIGLALNHLAHFDPEASDPMLARLAKSALTDADRASLRRGG